MAIRPAATTVAVRRSDEGPELMFVRRPQTMRAFGGFHAFPGGVVDPDDHTEAAAALSTLGKDESAAMLGDAAGDLPAIGFLVCALRELFEETGILYARRDDQNVVLWGEEVSEERKRLLAGGAPFPEILEDLGVKLATHRLSFLARWIAPEALPIRFDVRVFVIEGEGEPVPEPSEVERVDWLTPSHALALAEGGELQLAPPTVATVGVLSRYNTVGAMLKADGRQASSNYMERHSPLVRRIVAPNSTVMTGPGTNTYLVGDGEVIAIDPGTLEGLHLYSVTSAATVREIVVTHGHPDHISGTLELAQSAGAGIVSSHKLLNRLPGARGVGEGDVIEIGGVRLTVLDTPGHSSDHICLWLEEEKALFSGDLILGEGTTVISPPDGNLTDYLASLQKVAALGAERIYPGHFAPRDDAQAWIDYYIAHRQEREEQILNALTDGKTKPDEIVAVVYSSYPSALHPIAERSVIAHLDKLIKEGRVEKTGEAFRITG
jgi:glyoxylase-like metal-dependent hydrolase (beta-lactamase superfamily II)/8-oxo-dGTP pyrophosphatase MutT (NUDIX family)